MISCRPPSNTILKRKVSTDDQPVCKNRTPNTYWTYVNRQIYYKICIRADIYKCLITLFECTTGLLKCYENKPSMPNAASMCTLQWHCVLMKNWPESKGESAVELYTAAKVIQSVFWTIGDMVI